MHKFKKLS